MLARGLDAKSTLLTSQENLLILRETWRFQHPLVTGLQNPASSSSSVCFPVIRGLWHFLFLRVHCLASAAAWLSLTLRKISDLKSYLDSDLHPYLVATGPGKWRVGYSVSDGIQNPQNGCPGLRSVKRTGAMYSEGTNSWEQNRSALCVRRVEATLGE